VLAEPRLVRSLHCRLQGGVAGGEGWAPLRGGPGQGVDHDNGGGGEREPRVGEGHWLQGWRGPRELGGELQRAEGCSGHPTPRYWARLPPATPCPTPPAGSGA